MSGDIVLHPKYGLNPTMVICRACGEDTGEIALLGAAYKDEAPMRMCVNNSLCTKCRKQMETHTLILETKDSRGLASATGRSLWLRTELLDEHMRRNKVMLMLKSDFEPLLRRAEDANNNTE